MSDELTKKAAEMLLGGATLLGEPGPYCGGVRVMKDGQALCTGCGKRPESRGVPRRPAWGPAEGPGGAMGRIGEVLEKKLQALTAELEREEDHGRQQEILTTINSLLEAIEKAGKK